MSKIAVIYWSGTGNTQQMAEAIANQAHADLFTASEFTADKAANYDAFAFRCEWMDIWKRDNAGLNIVDTVICQDAPDDDALAACRAAADKLA